MTPTPEMIALAERIANATWTKGAHDGWQVTYEAALTVIMEVRERASFADSYCNTGPEANAAEKTIREIKNIAVLRGFALGQAGQLEAQQAEIERLRDLLSDAIALMGHRMPMDCTALVAGKTLVAREVWENGRNALFPNIVLDQKP